LLRPKFDLLTAMAVGGKGDAAAFIFSLEEIVKKYPNDEVKKKAEEMLGYLKPAKDKVIENTKPIYLRDDEAPHFVVVLFTDMSPKAETTMNAISDFNTMNYSLDNLNVNSVLFTIERKMILIQPFENMEKAMAYHGAVSANSTLFAGLDPTSYQVLVLSSDNYQLFFNSKDEAGYREFFDAHFGKP
jgi:hypothetical protein